jgi:hypothetical protein
MDLHTPWADNGSVGSIARYPTELVSSCGGCGRPCAWLRMNIDLGALEVQSFSVLLSGLSIHCTCSLHMVLLAQADSAYKDT